MFKKLLVNIVIIQMIILTCGMQSKVFAGDDLKNEYIVLQSEENKFLNEIYNTETESLKIKSINKTISNQNFVEKEIVETRILDNSNELYIRNQFGEKKYFNDGEYEGTLNISNINVEIIDNGYYEKIDEKALEFSGYLDNDLDNIEKEIYINDTKYYLINVEWKVENTQIIDNENVPITYKGRKIYQTVQKISNPNTYKITVTYLGEIEKIDTIYDYVINYEKDISKEVIEKKENKTVPIIIVSGISLIVLLYLLNNKNTYIYAKNNNGFKLIKTVKLNDKNVSIDISNCYKSDESVYAIKINPITFKKFKGRTISIVQGNRKRDIVIWNNYYEIRL